MQTWRREKEGVVSARFGGREMMSRVQLVREGPCGGRRRPCHSGGFFRRGRRNNEFVVSVLFSWTYVATFAPEARLIE